MAKDDYFVLAYRVLSYLYGCFKSGERPCIELFGPDALGINNWYWVNLMRSLSDEGYIMGLAFPKSLGGVCGVKIIDLRITQRGIEFLQDNNKIQKAVEFLKAMKEIVPGI